MIGTKLQYTLTPDISDFEDHSLTSIPYSRLLSLSINWRCGLGMSPQPTSTREDSRTKKKKKEAPEDGASDVALLKKNFLCPNPK